MDNAVTSLPPSEPESLPEPDTDFWKGFLLGAMAGMIVAGYTYVMADFNFAKPIRHLMETKLISQKRAA